MSCKPCQRCFVQVAKLLAELKYEQLSPLAESKARAMVVTLAVIGELLTAKEVQRIKGGME